jgi:hypothetical protein
MQLPYQGRKVAFLTKHGKQDLLRPILEKALGCHLLHTEDFDTDQLGTFTRDVNRPGSQLEAARRKAKIGMDLTGTNVGIASEGAFGPDPYTGFFSWDTEILLWVDVEHGIEVTGIAHGPAQSMHREVKSLEEVTHFATEAKFPGHHLVLRPDHQDHPDIFKNIGDEQSLLRAFNSAKLKSSKGVVFVENDLRAFSNPTRQEIIREAANDLIQKLLSACPKCSVSGFWRTKKISGLLCSFCHGPTRLPVAEIWRCQACTYEDEREINSGQFADPSKCDFCNP